MEFKVFKNIAAYPKLRKKFMEYISGVEIMPAGFTKKSLYWDYLKVRRENPDRRVSMSEYMIFGFYGIDLARQREYLTDVEATILMRPYNEDARPYLQDKVCFLKTFSEFVHRDWLYMPEASLEEFKAFIAKHPVLAAKPAKSSWGIGFKKIDTHFENTEWLYNDLREKNYLIEQFLVSAPELAKYHPASLNTLRVITFYRDGRFRVFGAGLRVGNNGRNVDNAHGGGIFCEVDPESGLIITDGLDECGNSYLVHPVTGVAFRGEQIPRWPEIVDLCRRASECLPYTRVVGWDVAILEDGSLEIIEGNHNPGMNIVQAPAKHGVRDKFRGMLDDFYGDLDLPDPKASKRKASAGQK